MSEVLKGSVGLQGKDQPKVGNHPDDVDMLRRMLRANGLMVAETGAVEPGLLKAIEAAQKKAGIKVPDGVVDPKGKTADYLRPKYLRAEAERESDAARVLALKLAEVTLQGEKLLILQKEHEKLVDVTLDRLIRYCTTLCRSNARLLQTYQDYLDVAQLERGLANAVVQAVVVRTFSIKLPDQRAAGNAIRAIGALERAMSKRSLQALMDTMPAAEQAASDFEYEVQRFLREFSGAAEFTGNVTALTSSACFAVVGALLTVGLAVPAVGMTVAQATAASGATVGILGGMSKELGAQAAGMDVTVAGSVSRVVLDGIIGAVGGWVTEKIPLGFVDSMAKSAAMKFGAYFPGVGAPQVKLFFLTYLQGSGSDTIKSSITESIGIVGKMVKEQRTPTQKDFDDAVQSVLIAALAGGLMKNMGSFFKNWETDADLYVSRNVVPDLLKKEIKSGTLTDKQTRKLIGDVTQAVSGEVSKAGIGAVIEGAGGNETTKELSEIAIRGVAKDRTIEALAIKEIEKALKKLKL